MNRSLWLGIGLILASNAVALAGVWYNRSGEAQAQLRLSERELRLSSDSWLRSEENSGVRLQLLWRQADLDWPWLDEAKLRELGFAPNDLGRAAERPIWLVLELDGPSYRRRLERVRDELASAQAAAAAQPGDEKLRQQLEQRRLDLRHETQQATRLLLVDAGLDAEALRQVWPDRQRQVILAGRLRAYRYGDTTRYSASVSSGARAAMTTKGPRCRSKLPSASALSPGWSGSISDGASACGASWASCRGDDDGGACRGGHRRNWHCPCSCPARHRRHHPRRHPPHRRYCRRLADRPRCHRPRLAHHRWPLRCGCDDQRQRCCLPRRRDRRRLQHRCCHRPAGQPSHLPRRPGHRPNLLRYCRQRRNRQCSGPGRGRGVVETS
jgi:hypothetical protein